MGSRGKWVLWVCFFGMFVPILMTLGVDFFAAVRSYTWKKVPCTILRSAVAEEPFSPTVTHHVVKAEYSYNFGGREYKSTRFTTGKHQGSTDVTKAEQAAARLAPGRPSTCYVNPHNPNEAVLQRGELWGVLFLFAPLLIVGLIAHEDIFAWFERREWRRRKAEHLPLSETNDALQTDGRLVLMAILGLVMGIFLGGFCVVGPIWRWAHAHDWVETDAVINRSELTSHSGMHGPQYSLELTYSYQQGGRPYRSDRRNFNQSIEEPVADLAAWTVAHQPGSSIRALVNPRDPTEAVLYRDLKIGWVSVSLSSLMLGFGLAMAAKCVQIHWLRKRLSGAALVDYCLGKRRHDPIRLRVFPPPLLSATGCAVAAVIAGTAGGWSLQKGIRALLNGQGDLINLLYGAGASIAAVWLVTRALKFLEKARYCRPVVGITPGTPVVGESFKLEWRFVGPRPKVEWLRIFLEGFEEAKVRHVTAGYHGAISEEKKERSMCSMFMSQPLVQEIDESLLYGNVNVSIPEDTMHSFTGVKSAVAWEVRIEFGKDTKQKLEYRFPVRLAPPKP